MKTFIKFYLAVILFAFPALYLEAENIVTLFAGNDSGKIQFAVSEIQTALNEKGHESVFRPVSQVNRIKSDEYIFILLNISDKAGSQLLKEVKVDRIQELKEEGFIIQKSGENEKTVWVLGKDDAGVMYGGLEIAEIIRVRGIDALKISCKTRI
jgi:alpha-glucuronidase